MESSVNNGGSLGRQEEKRRREGSTLVESPEVNEHQNA